MIFSDAIAQSSFPSRVRLSRYRRFSSCSILLYGTVTRKRMHPQNRETHYLFTQGWAVTAAIVFFSFDDDDVDGAINRSKRREKRERRKAKLLLLCSLACAGVRVRACEREREHETEAVPKRGERFERERECGGKKKNEKWRIECPSLHSSSSSSPHLTSSVFHCLVDRNSLVSPARQLTRSVLFRDQPEHSFLASALASLMKKRPGERGFGSCEEK